MRTVLLVFLSIILMSTKCTKDDEAIHIYNQSPKRIYYISDGNFPDTTLVNRNEQGSPQKLESFTSSYLSYGEDIFESRTILQVFFINADTFEMKGITYVYNNNVVESRKTYTRDQLRATGLEIYYP
jgi:hypothetical protein